MDVRLIAAIGRQGQLGLNGDMPWGRGHPEDLKRFRELTTGGIVVTGHRTFETVKHLDNTHGRRFIRDFASLSPVRYLADVVSEFGDDRVIWIAGGAKTYARFAPWVNEFVIRTVPYTGPADVFLPPLWSTK
nr:Dihydrofolate reductase [uncultured bacterium]